MNSLIVRNTEPIKQTLGNWIIFDGESIAFQCKTLELPWMQNRTNISRIAAGCYMIKKITHEKFGKCFEIMFVQNREGVLVHTLNFFSQTHGCIGVGSEHVDIDHDNLKDTTHSRNTLDQLWDILPELSHLRIIDLIF